MLSFNAAGATPASALATFRLIESAPVLYWQVRRYAGEAALRHTVVLLLVFGESFRAAMDGIQKHLKIRIILIHITDARCGGLYSHARLQILSAVSTVPAEGRGDETVNFAHQGIIGPWINRFSGAAMKRWFSWPDDSWQERAMGVTLSVTLISVTVLWVGALVLLVVEFAF